MGAKVNWMALGVAIPGAVLIGVAVGLGTGFAARALGWSTEFVGPLTVGLITALASGFYATRTKRDRGSASGTST